MNLQERELFWRTLCSLKGENLQEDIRQLIGKIKTPKYLYRYRNVNMNTLEAIRTNRLYFSTANYYDDPFDTFLHIDIEAIKKDFESLPLSEQNNIISQLQSVFRTVAHGIVYFILGVFATNVSVAFKVMVWHKWVYSTAFCFVYALSDEIHQAFVPGRAFQVGDIFVDTVGSFIGIATFVFIVTMIFKIRKDKTPRHND